MRILLLALVRRYGATEQAFLAPLFGVNQSAVYRHIRLADRILKGILSTVLSNNPNSRHKAGILSKMRLVAVYMHLLRGNMPRSPDPVGLNRDPFKVGRYLDGIWTGVRVGTSMRQQERSVVAVSLRCCGRVCPIFRNSMGHHGPHISQTKSKLLHLLRKIMSYAAGTVLGACATAPASRQA